MRQVFGHLPFCKIFLDDILIFSTSPEDHKVHLEEIFQLIKKNNIAINFEKSSFYVEEVKYLGQIISQKGLRPDIGRLETSKILCAPEQERIYKSYLDI